MLAFDIETTGLDPARCAVTVVALYGSLADGEHVDEVLNFARDGASAHLPRLLDCMGRARALCAFNGSRFDIPFLMHALAVDPRVCSAWVAKLVDPLEAMRLRRDQTMSLNALLRSLGMESKTGSGAEAVALARNKQWDELEKYCRQDAVLTLDASHALLQADAADGLF